MEPNVNEIVDCYGCGMCAATCPKQIIEIGLNSRGFYEPIIKTRDLCVSCGLCLDVCSFKDNIIAVKKSSPISSYAAWSNDTTVRKMCSSGGVGYEIARYLMSIGYKMVGVKYLAESNSAVHYIANSHEELMASVGSKYIQSYTVDALKQIKRNEKYLVTGTPCQIDSFRRYLKRFRCEDGFVLMDFFCHGVPSMFLWQKYSEVIKKKIGTITKVSWRNKTHGWHDSWDMRILGENAQKSSRLSQGDLFFKLFLSNSCLGKACYSYCKFKGRSSSADIRIGDLWGMTYKDDDEGVSGVIVYTLKGEKILKQTDCTLINHPYEIVAEGQLEEKIKEPLFHGFICWLLKKKIPLKITLCFVQMTRLPYLIKCKLKK